MNEQLVKVFELSMPKKLGIVAGVLVVIGAGFWFLIYSKTLNSLASSTTEVDRLNAEVAEKQMIAANLPKFEGEVERLDVELTKALAELPDKKDVDDLMDKISEKARDAGLDIKLFKPQAEQMRDFYAEIPVEIEVGGTYHQIATFFDEVGRLERIVNVDQFSLEEPQETDSRMIVKASVVATSFRFLDESERPKADDGDKDKGKKGRKRGKKKNKGEDI